MISEGQKIIAEVWVADLTTEEGRATLAGASARIIELQERDRATYEAIEALRQLPRFFKTIEQSDTGFVFARVSDDNGKCVGSRCFEYPQWNQERRLQRAHAWADRWLANCEKYVMDERSK